MEVRDEVAQPNVQEVAPMVEIGGLSRWFGELHILRDVSLSIGRGERIVICGPSGSGKSALLRCIVGLDAPDEGYVRVDGAGPGSAPRASGQVRRSVGMVFRQFNLFPQLTIMDNLLLGPMCAKDADRPALEAKAAELLDRVGLARWRTAYPHEMSAGQKRRAAIARALMRNPKVLLLDEPTALVPPDMAGEVIEVMAGIAGEGMTMLAVTNEMGFARDVADLIIYMEHGAIVEAVPPSALFDAPGEDLTRAFLSRFPRH